MPGDLGADVVPARQPFPGDLQRLNITVEFVNFGFDPIGFAPQVVELAIEPDPVIGDAEQQGRHQQQIEKDIQFGRPRYRGALATAGSPPMRNCPGLNIHDRLCSVALSFCLLYCQILIRNP
ncbi:hypothetical protein SDC9_210390 [bioreactor metagenome]|uniref:Uncharacterized protein n=1 Tax=bioreactor metagenome TaxID=1076179 RepID=A0A645JG09_9ZZZZ